MAAIGRGKDRKLWTFGEVEMVSVTSRRPEPQWGWLGRLTASLLGCSSQWQEQQHQESWGRKNREMTKRGDGAPGSTLVLTAIASWEVALMLWPMALPRL